MAWVRLPLVSAGQMAGRPVVVQTCHYAREWFQCPHENHCQQNLKSDVSRSELERLCRRQDFVLLDDRRLAAIGERKSEIEAAKERTRSVSRTDPQVPWFWIIAIAILVSWPSRTTRNQLRPFPNSIHPVSNGWVLLSPFSIKRQLPRDSANIPFHCCRQAQGVLRRKFNRKKHQFSLKH